MDNKVIIYGLSSDGGDPPVITQEAFTFDQYGFLPVDLYLTGTAITSTNPYQAYFAFSVQGIADMLPTVSFPYGFAEVATLDVNPEPIFVTPTTASVDSMDPDPAALTSTYGSQIVNPPANWSKFDNAAENVAATCTQAAVANARHVVTSVYATIAADTAAVAINVANSIVTLEDEDTNVLWSGRIGDFIANPQSNVVRQSGLNIALPENKGVTLKFAGASGANTFQSVSMTGYSASRIVIP
jgi:hypothetical protein